MRTTKIVTPTTTSDQPARGATGRTCQPITAPHRAMNGMSRPTSMHSQALRMVRRWSASLRVRRGLPVLTVLMPACIGSLRPAREGASR